jgi:hypothetical protein
VLRERGFRFGEVLASFSNAVWTRSFTPAGGARRGDVPLASGARVPGIGIDDQAKHVGWTVQAIDPTRGRGVNRKGRRRRGWRPAYLDPY